MYHIFLQMRLGIIFEELIIICVQKYKLSTKIDKLWIIVITYISSVRLAG